MNFNSLFIFIFYCFKFIFLLSNEELNKIEKKMVLKDSNTKLLFEKVFKTIKIMIENKYKNLNLQNS